VRVDGEATDLIEMQRVVVRARLDTTKLEPSGTLARPGEHIGPRESGSGQHGVLRAPGEALEHHGLPPASLDLQRRLAVFVRRARDHPVAPSLEDLHARSTTGQVTNEPGGRQRLRLGRRSRIVGKTPRLNHLEHGELPEFRSWW